MSDYLVKTRSINAPVPRGKGLSAAVQALEVGESVLLPTHAGSAVSTVANMRRKGCAGTFTVKAQGPGSCRVWRLT